MSGWKAKRFWKEVSVAEAEDGHLVHLDGRELRTPLKSRLPLPSRALAEAMAQEWEAQQDEVKPQQMPFTRTANSAVDKVRPQRDEVAAMLAAYAETDLLCYRAEGPEELAARQAAAWDPLLDWAAETYGARLVVQQGIMPRAQDPAALRALAATLDDMEPFQLAAFHDLVALPGSLILALATIEGVAPAETLWEAARLDDAWQEEQWGADEEATEVAEIKRDAFLHAHKFYQMVTGR